jgi:cation diffusion facilitator CzcD-associated flavoprotein CzcO
MHTFTHLLIHIHDGQVRNLESLALQDVLIVGLGNSAVDIAMALLDKGSRSITVSVASVPPIVRRQVRSCVHTYLHIHINDACMHACMHTRRVVC